jgi:uncharacterized damage-inducible protein DinB
MTTPEIDRYAVGPELLAYAVAGLSDEQLKARPGPGSWSIAEVAAHMADSDLVGADRMKRVIAEEDPTLYAYDQDAWIARLDSQNTPLEECLAIFAMNRRWITRLLRRCNAADFQRAGMHTERGRETLAHLVSGYADHLDGHLKFLYAKREKLGVPIAPRYSTAAPLPPS